MHRNYLVLTFLLLYLTQLAFGQRNEYELNRKKETFVLGAGLLFSGAGWLAKDEVKPLSAVQLANFNRQNINSFDRQASLKYNANISKASDYFLLSSFGIQGFFLLNKRSRNDFANISLIYGETLLLVSGLTTLTKSLVLRPRPYVYNEGVADLDKVGKKARFSFFSGHASVTAANCFFFASVFSDYFPDSKLKPIVWSIAVATPAITAYLRVEAGKHFPSDVIVGYAVGAAIGFLIPKLHQPANKMGKLSILPGINSAAISLRF